MVAAVKQFNRGNSFLMMADYDIRKNDWLTSGFDNDGHKQ